MLHVDAAQGKLSCAPSDSYRSQIEQAVIAFKYQWIFDPITVSIFAVLRVMTSQDSVIRRSPETETLDPLLLESATGMISNREVETALPFERGSSRHLSSSQYRSGCLLGSSESPNIASIPSLSIAQ